MASIFIFKVSFTKDLSKSAVLTFLAVLISGQLHCRLCAAIVGLPSHGEILFF
jgi:hypothetical protein